jgi:hypothetical protein
MPFQVWQHPPECYSKRKVERSYVHVEMIDAASQGRPGFRRPVFKDCDRSEGSGNERLGRVDSIVDRRKLLMLQCTDADRVLLADNQRPARNEGPFCGGNYILIEP